MELATKIFFAVTFISVTGTIGWMIYNEIKYIINGRRTKK